MAELEIHAHSEEHDGFGQKVGILAAVLAVALAIVTISSHRAHTAAVVFKSDANDQWSFYQSKRIKFHNLELGQDLIAALGQKDKNPAAAQLAERYEQEKKRYERESDEVQKLAREKEEQVHATEARALRYDLGEGMLEIGLVLSSLYFIAHKKLFPALGVIAGVLGSAIAITGFLM